MTEEGKGIERLRRAFVEWRPEREDDGEDSLDVDEFVNETYRHMVAVGNESEPEEYPILYNFSAAFMFRYMPVPDSCPPPEFIYVPTRDLRNGRSESDMELSLFMTEWDSCWEARHERLEMFSDRIPQTLQWLQNYRDQNVYLLPKVSRHKYYSYTPLFHLIPKRMLKRHGLPLLKRGIWPFWLQDPWLEPLIQDDFDTRLQRAFADLIWRKIDSGSGLASFSDSDSLKLLAHNLDYWLPYSYQLAENRLSEFPRVEPETSEDTFLVNEARSEMPDGLSLERPRTGGFRWWGEVEAEKALNELIEIADAKGNLRAIVEAIRSNRVEDDFSERWSFAKEDFERKLYRKRNKISVKFVELDDTIPVHGPDSEVAGNLIWEDFMGLLDAKERQIVVLLRSGHTRLADIAQKLGYANHSPVSKALSKIRVKAETYLL